MKLQKKDLRIYEDVFGAAKGMQEEESFRQNCIWIT